MGEILWPMLDWRSGWIIIIRDVLKSWSLGLAIAPGSYFAGRSQLPPPPPCLWLTGMITRYRCWQCPTALWPWPDLVPLPTWPWCEQGKNKLPPPPPSPAQAWGQADATPLPSPPAWPNSTPPAPFPLPLPGHTASHPIPALLPPAPSPIVCSTYLPKEKKKARLGLFLSTWAARLHEGSPLSPSTAKTAGTAAILAATQRGKKKLNLLLFLRFLWFLQKTSDFAFSMKIDIPNQNDPFWLCYLQIILYIK